MKSNRYRRYRFLLHAIAFLPALACGQVVITPGATLAAEGNPEIVIKTDKNIVNQNTFDFSSTQLDLELFSGAQAITGNLVVRQLNLTGGTQKTATGNLTVTHGIDFVLGLLEPGNAGKILYTGPAENLTGASENSHVNGMFYTQAAGTLFFPVGADGIGYAPAWLENGNASEVAVSVVASPAGFTFDPATSELQFLDNSRYWHVVGDLANINARVSLGLNGINVGNELTPVVVQSDNIGGIADNLQGLGESERVTSRQAISKSLVAIGGSKEVLLVIHDLITPFSEGHNDVLKIQNIKHFGTNKVTLLDRWGAPVKQWINFTNYDDAEAPNQDGYDFKQLSPGSYICIVEYGDAETGMRKKSQMISVLKAK